MRNLQFYVSGKRPIPHRVQAVLAARGGHTHYYINQPYTMPLIPSADLKNFDLIQYQPFLVRRLFTDTCHSGTP